MRIEPLPRDSGVEFTESLSGQNVDRVFVPSVEEGVENACREGILAGYKVVDVKIDFYDGKMHPVDSKDIAFQIAGYFAFKESFMKGRPASWNRFITSKSASRKIAWAKSWATSPAAAGASWASTPTAISKSSAREVPARELYKYSSVLRSLTAGRGLHSERLDHYSEMPRELEQKVIEEAKKRKAEIQAAK